MAQIKKVVTPIGLLTVIVTIGTELNLKELGLEWALIDIKDLLGDTVTRERALIGKEEALTIKPGKYKISARLGSVSSEETEIDVKKDEVVKINFHFCNE